MKTQNQGDAITNDQKVVVIFCFVFLNNLIIPFDILIFNSVMDICELMLQIFIEYTLESLSILLY